MAYARMCEVLREKEVKDGGSANFRKLLIARCQKEFERDYMEGFDKAKYEAELAAAESEDKRKALQAEFEEKERRARRRSLGNIRFIGELYNLKMLTDRIMHEIINKLIQQIDEESLECLCWLLTTIGKALENATNAKLNAPPSDQDSFKHVSQLFCSFFILPSPTFIKMMNQFILNLTEDSMNSWFLIKIYSNDSSALFKIDKVFDLIFFLSYRSKI